MNALILGLIPYRAHSAARRKKAVTDKRSCFFVCLFFLFLFVISFAAESIAGRFTELFSSHNGYEWVTAK